MTSLTARLCLLSVIRLWQSPTEEAVQLGVPMDASSKLPFPLLKPDGMDMFFSRFVSQLTPAQFQALVPSLRILLQKEVNDLSESSNSGTSLTSQCPIICQLRAVLVSELGAKLLPTELKPESGCLVIMQLLDECLFLARRAKAAKLSTALPAARVRSLFTFLFAAPLGDLLVNSIVCSFSGTVPGKGDIEDPRVGACLRLVNLLKLTDELGIPSALSAGGSGVIPLYPILEALHSHLKASASSGKISPLLNSLSDVMVILQIQRSSDEEKTVTPSTPQSSMELLQAPMQLLQIARLLYSAQDEIDYHLLSEVEASTTELEALPEISEIEVAVPVGPQLTAGSWACPSCTFINMGEAECEMCETERPADVATPDTAAPKSAASPKAASTTSGSRPTKKSVEISLTGKSPQYKARVALLRQLAADPALVNLGSGVSTAATVVAAPVAASLTFEECFTRKNAGDLIKIKISAHDCALQPAELRSHRCDICRNGEPSRWMTCRTHDFDCCASCFDTAQPRSDGGCVFTSVTAASASAGSSDGFVAGEPLRERLVGVRVCRGPNWEWDDQDGGPGKLGTTSADGDAGWIKVTWDATGTTHSYRCRPGQYDLSRAKESTPAVVAATVSAITTCTKGHVMEKMPQKPPRYNPGTPCRVY